MPVTLEECLIAVGKIEEEAMEKLHEMGINSAGEDDNDDGLRIIKEADENEDFSGRDDDSDTGADTGRVFFSQKF